MKMIVDIPEVFYEYCKSQEDTIEIQLAVKNGIPLDKIRDEIYLLHHHPKLDFIKNDDVVDMALQIIDKYTKEDKE